MHTRIVIPCYNEAERLPIARIERYLSQHADVSLVLVNDGSTDATLKHLQNIQDMFGDRVTIINLPKNCGKAEAVRQGMLAAMSDSAALAGYWDADLATPLEAIDDFLQVLNEKPEVDLVMGARVALLGRDIQRRAIRHYLGRIFATAASLVLGLVVYDTQCGAKLMRATPSTRALFAQPFRSRWVFDVEIIARYLASTGKTKGLYEFPLRRWHDVGASKVTSRDFLRAVGELASIYQSYKHTRAAHPVLAVAVSPATRYAAAGVIGTLAHYLMLATAVELLGATPPLGSGMGAVVGASVNYLLNYHVTFASDAPHIDTAPKFFLIAAVSVAVNASGVWLLSSRWGMHYLAAQVLCTVVVLVSGYLLNRTWTFATKHVDK